MNFNAKYEAYNSSWGKFLGLALLPYGVVRALLPTKDCPIAGLTITQVDYQATFIQKLPSLIFQGILTSYFIHNLYAQYQHNKSLEAQLKVEIDGEVKTINASPNYFDAYTTYNILNTVTMLCQIIGLGLSSGQLFSVSVFPLLAGVIAKLVSLGSNYQEYNLTDESGHSISHDLFLPTLEIQYSYSPKDSEVEQSISELSTDESFLHE